MAKITKRRVDSLEPGQTAWDSELKGFGSRCRGSSKSYVLKYRYYGRQRMYTIGRHGSPWTPETARKEAKRLLGMIAAGNDPSGERQGDKEVMTLAEVAKIFMVRHVEAKLKPNTRKGYRSRMKKHILPNFGRMPIHKITRRHISDFHYNHSQIPALANEVVLSLSKLFSWAEFNGYLPEFHPNPCLKIDLYKRNKRDRFLSQEEISRLHKVLDAESRWENDRTANPVNIFRMYLYTGARCREILDLKWSEVDFENRCLHLEDSKTGPKDIELNQQAIDLLNKLPRHQGNDHVFPGRKKGKPIGEISRPWKKIREAAGIEDVCIHDLRHTFASIAANSGIGLVQVKELLGHTDIKTTSRYAHADKKSIRESAEKMGQLLQPDTLLNSKAN